jgi:transcriptional regulator with XRE-family HTH domain
MQGKDTTKKVNPSANHQQRRTNLDIPAWLEREQGDWRNIRYLRRLCRMSQSDIAWMMSKHLGNVIDFTTISTHENNRRNPSIDQLTAYAKVFKVPIYYLICDIVPLEDLKTLLVEEGDWEHLSIDLSE